MSYSSLAKNAPWKGRLTGATNLVAGVGSLLGGGGGAALGLLGRHCDLRW